MSDDTRRTDPHPPPVDRLTQLWRRINEHKLVQWSVAYIAVAYAFQHAVVLTSEAFEWPEAVLRVSMLLMALGLPVVVTLAWYHGERASRHFSTAELTIISLLAVIGSVIFYAFVQPHAEVAADGQPANQQTVDNARNQANSQATAISVAVLPFANLSGDASQEFFSDGMTEEITAALSKVPDLRVVARGSAFQFKDEKRDRRAVGQALGATRLIEGSVRKAGDRVRVTVQLIRADNGLQVWSENYDRNLTDIFAIQEDIAHATAVSFNMQVGLAPGQQLVSSRNIDPASYEQFLRGKAESLKGQGYFAEQIAILEPVVARNANYAPAWAALARGYAFAVAYYANAATQSTAPEELLRLSSAYLAKLNAAGRRAIELDPNSVDGLLTQGIIQRMLKKWVPAEEFISKALALDPNNPLALETYSNTLLSFGRVKEALAMKRQLLALEPFIPVYAGNLAEALWLDGQTDAAIAVLKDNLGRVGAGAPRDLARIYASLGRYEEAADLISRFALGAADRDVAPVAIALLRSAPAKAPAPERLPPLGRLGFVYLYVGAPERALEYYEQDVAFFSDFGFIWHPTYAALRQTDRFKKIVRDAGLVDYWRVKGWPEFCRPTTGDDIECN